MHRVSTKSTNKKSETSVTSILSAPPATRKITFPVYHVPCPEKYPLPHQSPRVARKHKGFGMIFTKNPAKTFICYIHLPGIITPATNTTFLTGLSGFIDFIIFYQHHVPLGLGGFFHYPPTTRPGRFSETFQVFIYPKSFENKLYPPPGFRKPGGSVSKFLPSAIPASPKTHFPFSVYRVPKIYRSPVIRLFQLFTKPLTH